MRFSHHDKQHILRLLTQQGQIKRIFDHFTREVGLCLQQWSDDSSSPLSLWKRNPQLERKINELLQQLSNELKANISQNTDEAWNSANLKNDELVDDFVKRLPVSDLVGKGRWQKMQKGMLSRNIDALKAFKGRTVNDMTVSQRVWKVAEGAKSQLEHFISSGIASGRSAAEISRDVRHLLNDPDKRFRRVRNKEGKLVLSQPMKNFHPGRGVYRSSYKNALRLAATETNSAYRLADAKRWENMRFITGIEIKRSPANRGPCVICDSMKGEYPKDFVFTGWHPACWCIAVPIMMDDDDFIDLLVDNKTSSPVKQIEDIPEGAKKFINSNEKHLKLMSVQDNKGWFKEHKKVPEKEVDVSGIFRGLKVNNVEQKKVNPLKKTLTEEEIISRVGGGDLTRGSCASVALAYIGNKAGYDVLDFRDGASRSFFASNVGKMLREYGGFQEKDTNDFKAANRLVAKAEVGKEYLLCVGRHAAIVRKHPEEGWQYLELQSPTSNGYQRLTVQALKNRFGCQKSHTLFKEKLEVRSSMIDIEQLKGDDFKEILSYINTAPDKQKKGVKGQTR